MCIEKLSWTLAKFSEKCVCRKVAKMKLYSNSSISLFLINLQKGGVSPRVRKFAGLPTFNWIKSSLRNPVTRDVPEES